MVSKKNAQGAVEFIVIFSAFLLFFVILFSVIRLNMQEKNLDRERMVAQNIALDIQYEINLAAGSSEGYYREFRTPENLLGKDYNINVTENRVYVFIDEFSISYKVFNVTGTVNKGVNLIKKENGIVYLN